MARVALVFGIVSVSIASGPVITVDFFPYRQGWLGADAAYSIPLDKTTTLWLFGDTFVGKNREVNTMIHNSIAIRRCNRNCKSTYWWSESDHGKPDAFFRTPASNYVWPLDGFVLGGKLYVFLEQMHVTGDGGAFGFDYSGIWLASVSNLSADPDKWRISYRQVSTGNHAVPGIATAITEKSDTGDVYVFTLFRQSPGKPFVGLTRFLRDDLASDAKSLRWQYLSTESHWRDWNPSTAPEDSLQLLNGNITEMSVKYHPDLQKWLAVYPTPGFLSKTVSLSASALVSGPWTEARPFFLYPEMQHTDRRYTPNVFCYAAKEHPELAAKGQIAFTYACNSTKEPEIFRNLRLYRPELVVNKVSPIDIVAPNNPSSHQ